MTLTKAQLGQLLKLFLPYKKAQAYYILCDEYAVDIHIPLAALEEAQSDMLQNWDPLYAFIVKHSLALYDGNSIDLGETKEFDKAEITQLRSWLNYNAHQKEKPDA